MCFPSYPVTRGGDLVFVYSWDAWQPQSPTWSAGQGGSIFIALACWCLASFSIFTPLVDLNHRHDSVLLSSSHRSESHGRTCVCLLPPTITLLCPVPGLQQPRHQHPCWPWAQEAARCEEGPGRQREGRGGGPGLAGLLPGAGPCGHIPGLSPALPQTSQARGPPSPRWHLQGLVQGTELATHRHSRRWTEEKSLDPLLSQTGGKDSDNCAPPGSIR